MATEQKSDLDECRRQGAPIINPRGKLDLSPQFTTANVNRTNFSHEILANNNGWHPNTRAGDSQQQHEQISPLPSQMPQHVRQYHMEPPMNRQLCRKGEVSAPTDMDTDLSGLQSAAANTELVVRGKAARASKEVVNTEEADDQSSDWIFQGQAHVDFPKLRETNAIIHPSEHHPSDVSENQTKDHEAIRCSSSNTTGILPQDEEPADQTKKLLLLQKLITLRRQRRNLQQNVSPVLNQHLDEWDFRLVSMQQPHSNSLSTLEAVSSKRLWAEEEYQFACRWHVLGDVFLIWHQGPFGTINGFRLGRSARTMAGLINECTGGGAAKSGGKAGDSGGGGGGSSLFSWGGGSPSDGSTAASSASRTPPAAPERISVPWAEINSSLGQVVFLLHTLRNAPHSGISFRRHVLLPCGSASRVGVLKRSVATQQPSATDGGSSAQNPRNERRRITALAAYDGGPGAKTRGSVERSRPPPRPQGDAPLPGEVTWYNLHHYEENGSMLSMGYYARRNFNIALEGLLHCVAEACVVVERRDMSLAAPYIIKVGGMVVGKDAHSGKGDDMRNKEGEATVGGLPLTYDPMAGERWTAVCKYLLTNLKWLIAYAAKHIDR